MHKNIWNNRTRMSEKELAEYWGLKSHTLQKWRTLGIGPVYIKIGAHVIYTREAIEMYEQNRTFRGTGEKVTTTGKGGKDAIK